MAEFRTVLSIPNRHGSYDWSDPYKLPEPGRGMIKFCARGTNDVHVAISPGKTNSDPMYEIVIGGWANTQSVIRRSSQGPAVATFPTGLRSPGDNNWFEVQIDRATGKIEVFGDFADRSHISYVDPAFIADAQFVSFSTWDTPIDYSVLYCGAFLHQPGEASPTMTAGIVMHRPSIVYGFTPGRIDVFWCAPDESSLMHTWSDGPNWRTELIAEGDHPFAPSASVYPDQPGRMDVGWIERWGKIKYRQFSGGQWLPPVELNPSSMRAASGSPPSDFHLGSPLAGCPGPANRKTGNTEFFVKDVAEHLWNLSFDGTTWTVTDCHTERVLFDPVQIWAKINTPSPVPNLFWCDAATGAMHVSRVGDDPNSVNTFDVPNASTAVQPVVLEGLTPGRVDIFCCAGGSLMHTVWDGSGWSTETITEYNSSFAAAAVYGLRHGRVDLFWCSEKGELIDTYLDGENWRNATIASGLPFFAPPAAVYDPAHDKAHLFWVDAEGALIRTSSDGDAWEMQTVFRTTMIPAPPVAICGYQPGRMDVLWGGVDKQLKQATGDGTTWNSVRLNPGRMASPVAVAATRYFDWQMSPDALEFFWADESGALWFQWFDGNWNVRQLAEPGSVKSPLYSYNQGGNPAPGFPPSTDPQSGLARHVCYVNNDNQLVETRLRPERDWWTHVFNFTSNPESYGWIWPGQDFIPPAFSSRFAPSCPTGTFGTWMIVCDTDLMLWLVAKLLDDMTDTTGPVRCCQHSNLGPVAYAPTCLMVSGRTPASAPATSYVFWCAKEDKSFRQSWVDQNFNWHTVTIDPGPILSTPAIYYWLNEGPVHIFLRGRDGSLQHEWAYGEDMGEHYRAAGWQTETIDPGPVCSDPYAVNNQGRIYVFWLDSSGKLQQTSQNEPAGQAGWSTINIAPATNDGSN